MTTDDRSIYGSLQNAVLSRQTEGEPSLFERVQAFSETNGIPIADPRSLKDVAIAAVCFSQGMSSEQVDSVLSQSPKFGELSGSDQQKYLMSIKAVVSVAMNEQQADYGAEPER